MTSEKLKRIIEYFDDILPEAGCELVYRKPHELLIAVVLSAQTSDASVNKATPALFNNYPTVVDLAQAPLESIEQHIRAIGLYRTKAKHVKALCMALLQHHQGKVPSDKAALLALPGVGVKTANVVRAELFKIPEIAVDTHVARISKRLGFAKLSDDVNVIERKLRKALPVARYIKTHHQMIHFGRYYCPARGMNCSVCPLVDICVEKHKNLATR
ncbi:MAG TPA: endonuclease III [Bacilli bacterium]|jgi:endonuclease-3|nr:endonuclease III [Bacilli bacterium]